MDVSQLDTVRQLYSDRGESVLFVDFVKKFHDTSSGSAQRIMVASEFQIAYYKEEKTPELNRNFFWVDITNISYDPEEKTIEIKFLPAQGSERRRKCMFSCDKNDEYVKIIANHLARIMPGYKAELFGVKELSDQTKDPVAISAIVRMMSYSKARDINIPVEIFNDITKLIKERARSVIVKGVEDAINVQTVQIAGLQVDPSVEEIVLSQYNGCDNFRSLGMIPQSYYPFKHITLDDEYKESLGLMLQKVSDNMEKFHTTGITLANTKMDENNVKKVASFFTKIEGMEREKLLKPLERWIFDGAVLPEAIDALQNEFLSECVCENLKVLGIDHSEGINVEIIVGKIKNAEAISFAYDELEVGGTLKTILSANIPSIKAICLAGNKGSELGEMEEMKVQTPLQILDISNSRFADGQLVSLFKFIFNTQFTNGVTLFASGIDASDDEIESALGILGSIKDSPLVGLSWSNNKITPSLISVIKSSPKLSTLYLSNCLSADDNNIAQELGEALEEITTLEKFVMSGSKRQCGKTAIPILKGLKHIKKLRWLDVSSQSFSSEGLHIIHSIIDKTRLSFLSFDGSDPQSSEPIDRILLSAQNRGSPILISYPVSDSNKLQMDESKLIVYINSLAGEKREEYNEKDQFTRPFDVYVHQSHLDEKFPYYLNNSVSKELETIYNKAEPSGKEEILSTPKMSSNKTGDQDASFRKLWKKRKNNEQFLFYLNGSMSDSEPMDLQDSSLANTPQTPTFKDGFNADDNKWEFAPEFFEKFDCEQAKNKLKKKYDTPVLREQIQ